MRILTICLLVLLLVPAAMASTIHGTVYDLFLGKQEKAQVVIDTTPKQTFIAKDGAYSFDVSNGQYTITASYYEDQILLSKAEENITITREGDYVIDLILFPVIADDTLPPLEVEEEVVPETSYFWWYVGGVVMLIVLLYYVQKTRKLKKALYEQPAKPEVQFDDSNDLAKVVAFIKAQGGRVTQKDIRKEFPSSEAKISLLLTELEEQGKIQKIKKGRGNVIILK